MSVDTLALFGTAEPAPERRLLRAGALSAILEEGNLRAIRYGGVEVVRAVNYLARDTSWGTYKAELSNIVVDEGEDTFAVTYDGLCAGPEGRFSYRMRISGEASGRLTLEATGEALIDFPTNRTGFVVLHPAEAAGGRLTIRHGSGEIEETVFPEAISPDQPAFDIAALTHEAAPGLTCTVAMEGDAFEMEDQRNWADASFKTYVRPLSKPRPYTIGKGKLDRQSITITVAGRSAKGVEPAAAPARLTIGGPAGRMPSLALFLDAGNVSAAAHAEVLGSAQHLIVRFDRPSGDDPSVLARAAGLAERLGATLVVEAVLDARDAAAEAGSTAAAIEASGVTPDAVLVSPRREFRTRPSDTLPPGECPIGELVAALRDERIGARIGAGTPCFFTEFNRNSPSGDGDFVFFSIASNVHAADDVSVMETLSVYPAIIASARRLCPGKPIWLGPCTIAMRHNPYGAAVAANPDLVRKPGAGLDPRHGALFGAAFATGVAAAAAKSGVECLILAAPIGPFGLVDDAFRARPIQRVHALLARAAGAERLDVDGAGEGLAALAFRDGAGLCLIVANLAPSAITVRLPATPISGSLVAEPGELLSVDAAQTFELQRYRTAIIALPDPNYPDASSPSNSSGEVD